MAEALILGADWILVPESPSEGSGRRRVDLTLKYLGGNGNIAVLAFHEAKPLDAGLVGVREAEEQARYACIRYLGKPENAKLGFVYAVTTFGTKGRTWQYTRGDIFLEPLFGPQRPGERRDYIELHWKGLMATCVQMRRARAKY